MNGKQAKKLRKEARKVSREVTHKTMSEFKKFVNEEASFPLRLKTAVQILFKSLK